MLVGPMAFLCSCFSLGLGTDVDGGPLVSEHQGPTYEGRAGHNLAASILQDRCRRQHVVRPGRRRRSRVGRAEPGPAGYTGFEGKPSLVIPNSTDRCIHYF